MMTRPKVPGIYVITCVVNGKLPHHKGWTCVRADDEKQGGA